MKKLMLLVALMPLMVLANKETVDGITWTFGIIDGKACIGTGSSFASAIPVETAGELKIPSSLGGCPVTSIEDGAFRSCEKLTAATIPEGVTSIGVCAFVGCGGLTSVTIPEGVTSIGRRVFYGCYGLKSMTMPSSVTNIGYEAFYGCTGLKSITIPDGVTSIGYCAFRGCLGLKSITISSTVKRIEGDAFSSCNGIEVVYVKGDVEAAKRLLKGSGLKMFDVKFEQLPADSKEAGAKAAEEAKAKARRRSGSVKPCRSFRKDGRRLLPISISRNGRRIL